MQTDKNYRKKSLLIHPDKLKHERGIEAFDLLKKVPSPTSLARPATDLSSLSLLHLLSSTSLLSLSATLRPKVPSSTLPSARTSTKPSPTRVCSCFARWACHLRRRTITRS